MPTYNVGLEVGIEDAFEDILIKEAGWLKNTARKAVGGFLAKHPKTNTYIGTKLLEIPNFDATKFTRNYNKMYKK